LRPILKEPLLHFVVLGVGLFLLYRFIAGDAPSVADEIVVDAPRIAALAEQFERSWRRPPTAAELDGLVETYVRDEVLYREGLALGLDRDDPMIRSRVRLKMEVIGGGPDSEVGEADLQTWLDAHADRYATPARYDVQQVFFDPAKHAVPDDRALEPTLRDLARDPKLDPTALGDVTLLPAVMSDVTRADVASQFGDDFAGALTGAPNGRWSGPVTSAYGKHLLRVDLREEQQPAQLADVRNEVERDLRYARDQAARDAVYARLRARRTVRIEKPALQGTLNAALAAEPR
jgi:hypothetical protein